MRMEWEDETPFGSDQWSIDHTTAGTTTNQNNERLDLLLPTDEQTGVTAPAALRVYLDAMIEMAARSSQPLSLLCIAVDETPIIRFFGTEGVHLIGRAVARCLRQETRSHDVVGRADVDTGAPIPIFMVVCALLDEEHAAQLADRLRVAMTAPADAGHPWLTLSVGVAALALDIADGNELMARAFAAMHRAQSKGGSRVWRNSESLRSIIEEREHENPDDQF